MEKRIGILRFEPRYRSVRWGGERLGLYKGITLPDSRIGESWEVSGLEGLETTVAEGPYKGKTVTELLRSDGARLMGQRLYDRFGNFFRY